MAKWNAQWQQQPTSEETSIIKREWWQEWKKEQPPLQYIIQSYDTAFSSKTTSDYSAITTWGVFYNEVTGKQNVILMEADRGRWDFPELKKNCIREKSVLATRTNHH